MDGDWLGGLQEVDRRKLARCSACTCEKAEFGLQSRSSLELTCCCLFSPSNFDKQTRSSGSANSPPYYLIMDITDISPALDQLVADLDQLETDLGPLLGDLGAASSKLPLLDKAKLYVLTSYTIESLLFCTPDLEPSSFPDVLTRAYSFTTSQRH